MLRKSLMSMASARIVLILLVLMCLPIVVTPALAKPPEGKGKPPGKGDPGVQPTEITFIGPDILSNVVDETSNPMVVNAAFDGDGRLTFARANWLEGDKHVPPYWLTFVGDQWDAFEGTHQGRDLEMSLSWPDGTISFVFWFGETYKLIEDSGSFTVDGAAYTVTLEGVGIRELLRRTGPPSERYILHPIGTVTFTMLVPTNSQ